MPAVDTFIAGIALFNIDLLRLMIAEQSLTFTIYPLSKIN